MVYGSFVLLQFGSQTFYSPMNLKVFSTSLLRLLFCNCVDFDDEMCTVLSHIACIFAILFPLNMHQ